MNECKTGKLKKRTLSLLLAVLMVLQLFSGAVSTAFAEDLPAETAEAAQEPEAAPETEAPETEAPAAETPADVPQTTAGIAAELSGEETFAPEPETAGEALLAEEPGETAAPETTGAASAAETPAETAGETAEAAPETDAPETSPSAPETVQPESTAPAQPEQAVLEKDLTASDRRTYRVTVTCDRGAAIPADAKLVVREIVSTNKDYKGYLDQAADALNVAPEQIAYSRIFDISLVSAATGESYQPEQGVKVSIRMLADAPDKSADVEVVHFGSGEDGAPDVRTMDGALKDGGASVEFTTDGFSVFVVAQVTLEKTITAADGRTYKISVSYGPDAGLPQETSLQVTEFSGADRETYIGRAAVLMGAAGFGYARVFDISLTGPDGAELQPAAPVQVTAELADAEAGSFSVVHFGGPAEQPERMTAETDGGAVTFRTEGFSAYAIVQGPADVPMGWTTVKSLEEFTARAAQGLYVGHPNGYYFRNTTYRVNNTSRTGILKTTPPASYPPEETASLYYFVPADGPNLFYAYCYAPNGQIQYVRQSSNSLSFTTSETDRTAFTFTVGSDGVCSVYANGYYWNMQGDDAGKGFAAYTQNNNGSRMNFWYYDAPATDPYGLDGTTYGLMRWNGGTAGKALMGESSAAGRLDAKALTVMTQSGQSGNKLFVPSESEISFWTFRWVSDNKYHLTTETDGGTRYLRIAADGLSLAETPDEDCRIRVIPGTGVHAGEIALKNTAGTLTYSGNITQGFQTGGSVGEEWLHLVEESELTSDYFQIFSARKVGVSDPEVTNGSRIIVYTRSWDPVQKKYVLYAIDSDGTLVPCYESGDSIQWVGGQINTMLWNLTEHYWEGTNDPNYYYDLYNQYSEQFIAPQSGEENIFRNEAIGINLNGRRNGRYYSTILAWDQDDFSYVGLKVENGRIVSCPMQEADDFYFAIMQDLPVDDQLTPVPTVDHTRYGITMRIVDFDTVIKSDNGGSTSQEQQTVLGDSSGGTGAPPRQGLLSTDLTGGYPTAVLTGRSLGELYAGATQVNHLFINSTYSASGYYEFDSTQNFASLHGSEFTVYKELGTYDASSRNTLKHGQFFPYNDLEPGVFASLNGKNLYDALAHQLPNSDPRKGEQLYLIRNVDCYFGVELEAGFTQTPSGHDNWGHDIIYEFTGDDDFWLYVDGELIIDLGGIHSALPGSVNYSTGEVSVNGVSTTLKDLFYNNFKGRGHTDAEAQVYVDGIFEQNDKGQWVFKEYSTHTMKIFFMERGGGASNLHMRFNLASVKPGTVELSKTLSGVDETESVLAEFPYQVWYLEPDAEGGEPTEKLLTPATAGPDGVVFKETTTSVPFRSSVTVDGVSYENVFLLQSGETAEISLPEDVLDYRIVECGVDTTVYDAVTVNGEAVEGTAVPGHADRADFDTGYASHRTRARVAYVNTVDPDALRTLTFTKKLYREDGVTPLTNADDAGMFSFRLNLATEFSEDVTNSPADMHIYHIRNEAGEYCRWNSRTERFESVGTDDYTALSAAQKESVSFATSMYGQISKVPAFYTVEVRNVLAGTQYQLVERPKEIPDGYSFQKYVQDGVESDAEALTGVSDTVVRGQDPHVDVCNMRGWGLRVNKVWSDADYITQRDPVYFAVFTGTSEDTLTLVDGTVRCLPYGEESVYWYFPTLPVSGVALGNYKIREVTLSAAEPSVDDEGVVTEYGTAVPVRPNGTVQVYGIQTGGDEASLLRYTVQYEQGELPEDTNVRVDTATNSRPSIELKKEDWNGAPLAGAEFTLTDENGTRIGTFTSDAEGDVTLLFLREDVDYTLTETAAPQGYYGLQEALTLRLHGGDLTVTGADPENYTRTQEAGVTTALTVRNRPCTLTVVKQDGDFETPIAGVHFALHRQVTVDHVTTIDLNPMTGYEDLVTNASGVVPGLDMTLAEGVYELRETAPAGSYRALPSYIRFSIGASGAVALGSHPEGTDLSETVQADGTMAYTLTIRNYLPAVAPTGLHVSGSPYGFMALAGLILAAAAAPACRRRARRKDGGAE